MTVFNNNNNEKGNEQLTPTFLFGGIQFSINFTI